MHFFGLLTLIFITLKLTGFIAWSWWLVLLPVIWLPICVGAIIASVFALTLCALLIAGLEELVTYRRNK